MPILQEAKSYYQPISEISYNLQMDEVRKLLVEKTKEAGETLASLSNLVGKNHAYLQQFVKRGVPTRLPEDVRHKLATRLNIPETALGARPDSGQIAAAPLLRPLDLPPIVRPADEIPLYGQILGGRLDAIPFDDEGAGFIERPPALSGVRGAYAAYVVGDSMEPRYRSGEVVYINPRQPPKRNDYVAVQLHPEEGGPVLLYVKKLISGWPASVIKLEQHNPKRVLEYPAKRVKQVHRVVMSGEG